MAEIPPTRSIPTAEVKADTRSGEAVADFDWDNYLDN